MHDIERDKQKVAAKVGQMWPIFCQTYYPIILRFKLEYFMEAVQY